MNELYEFLVFMNGEWKQFGQLVIDLPHDPTFPISTEIPERMERLKCILSDAIFEKMYDLKAECRPVKQFAANLQP